MTCGRVGWIDSPDHLASCPEPSMVVADDEAIARLLHSGNADSPKERLRRDDLFPPKGREVKNVCDDDLGSDGASLIRCGGMDDDDLRTRSHAYAAEKESRQPRGAIRGAVGAVRAVRSRIDPEMRVVHVYDDPTKGEPMHVVMRCSSAGRSEQDYLRTEILSALAERVEQ